MMFDVHIGAPGILNSQIHRVAGDAAKENPASFFYVMVENENDPIRKYVENRDADLYIDQLVEDDAMHFMRHLLHQDHVLLSYPKFLGQAQDIVGKRPYRLMDRRVARLDDLLESCEMTLHLMVVSPVDMLMSYSDLPMRLRLKLISQTRLSWANIAWRILRAAPKRKLVVWNCERARRSVEAFFETIMQRSTAPLQRQRIKVPDELPIDLMESSCSWMAGIEDEIMHLDEQFEIDLQKIDEMPRATLQNFSEN